MRVWAPRPRASWRQAPLEPLHRTEKGRAREGNREQFDALKCFEVPTPNPLRDSLSEQRFPHLPMFGLRMKPYAHNCRAECQIRNLAGARIVQVGNRPVGVRAEDNDLITWLNVGNNLLHFRLPSSELPLIANLESAHLGRWRSSPRCQRKRLGSAQDRAHAARPQTIAGRLSTVSRRTSGCPTTSGGLSRTDEYRERGKTPAAAKAYGHPAARRPRRQRTSEPRVWSRVARTQRR